MMQVPRLKVVAPSAPRDVVGLMAAAVRDDNPVMFMEHKALLATKQDVEDGEIAEELGKAKIVRTGERATIVALAAMVPKALQAAEILAGQYDIDCTVIDLRSLVPLDVTTVLNSFKETGRLFTVEENPRLLGWGAELVSIAVEEAFDYLDGAPVRITHAPHPAAAVALPRGACDPVGRPDRGDRPQACRRLSGKRPWLMWTATRRSSTRCATGSPSSGSTVRATATRRTARCSTRSTTRS